MLHGFFTLQVPVVQALDNAIHRINHYPAPDKHYEENCAIHRIEIIYPVDSVIHLLNNWAWLIL